MTSGIQAQQQGDRAALVAAVRASEFSDVERTVDDWLQGDAALRGRVLASSFAVPPALQPAPLTPGTLLDSAEWHAVKHRQHVNDHWIATATLHDYLSDLLNCMTAGPGARVVIGHDAKAMNALRVGLLVRLGANGHPCLHLCPALHTTPAVHMFIAWNPRDAVIVTGFPIPGRAVANGYPSWQNQIEVTR